MEDKASCLRAAAERQMRRPAPSNEQPQAKRQKTAVELDLSTSNPDPPIPEEVLNMLDAINPGDEALAARPTTVAIYIVMLQLLAEQVRHNYCISFEL